MARLSRADRKAMVTQIIMLYTCGEQKSISECFEPSGRWLGSTSVSQKQKAEAAVATGLPKTGQFKIKQNVAWSDESRFLLRNRGGMVRI